VAEELDQPEGALPPPTEQIHLPDPSHLPWIMAFGITLMVTGVVLSIVLVIVGAILVLITLVKWIGDTRREMAELPLEH
jgi:hypothetical protein